MSGEILKTAGSTKMETKPCVDDVIETPESKMESLQNLLKSMDLGEVLPSQPQKKEWKFWDTQPVPKMGEKIVEVGKIEADKKVVRQEPYSLPGMFEWSVLDLNNELQLEELYQLLTNHYVEDDDFRFDYSAEFLKWILQPPSYIQDWHCGVRAKKSGKLVGFISAVPAKIKVHHVKFSAVEINFLCVHKKLRSKRVAPVLIREVTRRVNARGVFQATYTSGTLLPKPVVTCKYFHRPLNVRKLVSIKFWGLKSGESIQRLTKLMRLPTEPQIQGFRSMQPKDVQQCQALLSKHLEKFKYAPVYSVEEIAHYFLPRPDIIDTFVVEDKAGKITDMSSFFSLPSSVSNNHQYNGMKAAFSFHTVVTKHSQSKLMKDVLVMAKMKGYDVFNALNVLNNSEYFNALKFSAGSGNLHYYLYNFKCPDLKAGEVGLVLQ